MSRVYLNLDADTSPFFNRQLEHIKAKSYDVIYADLVARQNIPVSNEAPAHVNEITYRTYDMVGVAKIISSYAKDLPRVDIAGKETTSKVRPLGCSFGYNVNEILASQATGLGLDQRRANTVQRAIEELIDSIAWSGDADFGLQGFLSNPNIPVGNVPNGAGGFPEWTTKTPAEILADVNAIMSSIWVGSLMKEVPNTLLLPPAQYSYIHDTPRSDVASDTTILQYILNNSQFLNGPDSIRPVNKLTGAGTAGADIMVAYRRDPDKLTMEIPKELDFLAPQERGLEIEVPAWAKTGGTIVYYPLSAAIREKI